MPNWVRNILYIPLEILYTYDETLCKINNYIRFGGISPQVIKTIEDGIPTLVEYYSKRNNKLIGIYKDGEFDPNYPFQGRCY